MKKLSNKNMKWWVGTISFAILFIGIATFAYMKMGFLIKGVKIQASINHDDTSPVVKITGNAKNAIYLSLNGREIFIDKDGSFTEPVALLPGLSVVTLDAQDKFGKTASKKFEVMYKETTGVAIANEIITTN